MSRRVKRILASMLLGFAALFVVVTFSYLQSMNWFQARETSAHVKHLIKQELPLGATVEQTIAFLHKHSIQTDESLVNNRGSSDDFEAQDQGGRTLYAAIPTAYPGLLTSGGIFMKFGFNAKGRLTRYSIKDVYTGL